jgi:HK97 family phage major capsid protein
MSIRVTKDIEEARELVDKALSAMEDQETVIQAMPDDTPDETRAFQKELFESRKTDFQQAKETFDRLVALKEARDTLPNPNATASTQDAPVETRVQVGREPLTYGPQVREHSFLSDIYKATIQNDPVAMERLQRNNREQIKINPACIGPEQRAGSTTVTAGGNFIPPQYLGQMYAEYAREGRPFADVVPSSPLMDTGMSLTIPRITTGTVTASQSSENSSLGTQDIVEALLTVAVRTIGGYVDLSVQLLERSDPSMDQIYFNDLRADYDHQLDTQLISGSNSSGQHLGIRAVSSIQTVSYTDASPTAAEFLPSIYNGIQKVATTRFRQPTHIIAHGRRLAWLASNLSSTFPLFQLGGLYQAAGQQNNGFAAGIAGLNTVQDNNIATNYSVGGNTNEDEVYVVYAPDFHLWESPPRVEVFRDVGSANGTVRLRLYAYSAFASGRFPGSICKIAGSGMSAPSF